jgi:hypothetical protein
MAPLYVKTALGRRVGWLVAGPGSGLSEEPMSGVRSVTLDCRVVPECPPGPELPEPEARRDERDPMPSAVSDDGRTIAGTHTEWVPGRPRSGVPVRWQCR